MPHCKLQQLMKNPWKQDLSAYVFFSKKKADRPMDADAWAKYMREALKSIGYSDPEKICFHSFRHGWCTTTLSEIGDHRICMIGSGHKSDKIFAHYANHIKKESALKTIAETSEKLFAPIFEKLAVEEVEYTIKEVFTAFFSPLHSHQKALPFRNHPPTRLCLFGLSARRPAFWTSTLQSENF